MTLEHLSDVERVIRPLMDGFAGPWCVASGWALDLFLGRMTRSHAVVELAIFRADQALLHRHFSTWVFEKIVNGRRQVWSQAERLILPVHEILARSKDGPPDTLEFLLNERKGDNWVYRRDPAIHVPIERALLRSNARLPVLAPKIGLLFKSKSPRAKDAADFASISPALNVQQRLWLMQSIAATEPEHPWLGAIAVSNAVDA